MKALFYSILLFIFFYLVVITCYPISIKNKCESKGGKFYVFTDGNFICIKNDAIIDI